MGLSKKSSDGAISVANHDKNEYLEVCDFLVNFPEVTATMIPKLAPFHVVDIALMLQVRGKLYDALLALMQLEYQENKRRGVAAETFRTETSAVLLISAVMSLDNVMDYRQTFISDCVGFVMQRFSWNAKALAKVVKSAIKALQETSHRMPEELVSVIKALHQVAPEMPQFQASLFFLRFLCPGLAQPQEKGGLDKIPDDMKRNLMELAKALQLIANRVDPAEHAFSYPIRADLQSMYRPVEKLFEKITNGGNGATSPPVTKSLEEPARATLKALKFCELQGDSLSKWQEFNERFGPFSSDEARSVSISTSREDFTDTGSSVKSI